jgi:hypothetical protein
MGRLLSGAYERSRRVVSYRLGQGAGAVDSSEASIRSIRVISLD